MKIGEERKKLKAVVTHANVDLDAVSSAWAAYRFMATNPGEPQLTFMPASWTPRGHSEQVAEFLADRVIVDMDAGGYGIKGHRDPDGTTHSCFAMIVGHYASEEDQRALAPLVAFVDAQDISAHAVRHLAPQLARTIQDDLLRTSLVEVLWGIKAKFDNDYLVCERMFEILDGLLLQGRQRLAAEADADRAEFVGNAHVAIIREPKFPSTARILFDRGALVVVYVDGNDIGINRNPEFTEVRMDSPMIRVVVEATGETIGNGGDSWFAHPAGFLFCRGSHVAHAPSPSKVNPMDLARAVQMLLALRPH